MRWAFLLGLLAAMGWISLLAGGWYAWLRHDYTPGAEGQVHEDWPQDCTLALDREQLTLVLFAHRSCPCTRQTLGELKQILERTPGRVSSWIVLLSPADTAGDRTGESVEALARSLPGVRVIVDPEGTLARRFGVRTSGHVLLYDPNGRLLYSGGITDGRGHVGESVGRRAVLARLRGQNAAVRTAPVYGCSLFNDEEQGEAAAWE